MQRLPEIEGLEGAKKMTSFLLDCRSLREITLPDMPEVLSLYLFAEKCGSLRRVTIGAMTKCRVITHAFKDCTKLETVTIGDCPRVNNMISAFSGCSSLRSVTIDLSNNSEMKNIDRAFFGCSSLQTITGIIAYPDRIRGGWHVNHAFDGCTSLQEVRIKSLLGTIDLSDCHILSMESIRYLVENAATVKNEQIIHLSSKLLDSHKEELDALGAVASGKGFTFNYR